MDGGRDGWRQGCVCRWKVGMRYRLEQRISTRAEDEHRTALLCPSTLLSSPASSSPQRTTYFCCPHPKFPCQFSALAPLPSTAISCQLQKPHAQRAITVRSLLPLSPTQARAAAAPKAHQGQGSKGGPSLMAQGHPGTLLPVHEDVWDRDSDEDRDWPMPGTQN